MKDPWFNVILVCAFIALSYSLWESRRAHSELMLAVLTNLKAECDAGSQATYCKPRPIVEERCSAFMQGFQAFWGRRC